MRSWRDGEIERRAHVPSRPNSLLNPATVVSPIQQRLPLAAPAEEVARLTIFLHLPHMTEDCFPALDLPAIFVRHAPAHVIAAVPLEPATRIVGMDPAFALPFR